LPYSSEGLAGLPGLETGRPAQFRQIGIHVNGGLFSEATIRVGSEEALDAPQHPPVEGRLGAGFVQAIDILAVS
jgi:hypothetical protein